jgi:hypothetical protein
MFQHYAKTYITSHVTTFYNIIHTPTLVAVMCNVTAYVKLISVLNTFNDLPFKTHHIHIKIQTLKYKSHISKMSLEPSTLPCENQSKIFFLLTNYYFPKKLE